MNARTLVLVGLATFGMAVDSESARADAPVRSSNRGATAGLAFSSESTAVCSDGSTSPVFTSVQITARERVIRDGGPPEPETAAEILLFTFNTCGFGTFTSAFGSLSTPTYDHQRAQSATLAGDIPLFDMGTGLPLGTASIALSFSATETPARSTRMARDVFGNVTVTSRSIGIFADATATGTVVVDGLDLYEGATEVSGQLGINAEGTRTFTRFSK